MNLHDEDRDFLQTLPKLTDKELLVFREWQATETWRRIAIEREMVRRKESFR